MNRISVGKRLYVSVLSVFLVFAFSFVLFQWNREKHYRVLLLETKLQDFNERFDDAVAHMGGIDEKAMADYVGKNGVKGLRVTVVDGDGNVRFDNVSKDYKKLENHGGRPEIMQAVKTGTASVIERNSKTLNRDYFYSATFFPRDNLIIRTALPYDDDLSNYLRIDQYFIWFAIIAVLVLTLVLYRFVNRLGTNITKLKIFAARAELNESLEIADLSVFPADELGEIAEKIIKIYKRLQSVRHEQDVMKRQLTQNIAHELKTPLASIQGYLETILSNPHTDEAVRRQFLERCYAQSGRLASLLQDISTLNRMDDAPDMQDVEKVDIADLVRSIQKETALQLQEREMTFENNLPEGIKVWGCRSLLYSIFRNLTDNAIAYSGVGTAITLEAERLCNGWMFRFADNGVGVSVEHLDRIFERFYRVDKGRSRKMGGTGLGLAIVKNAVLMHGGNIKANTLPDGGLLFTFSIAERKDKGSMLENNTDGAMRDG